MSFSTWLTAILSIRAVGSLWGWTGCQWKPLQNPGNHSGNQRLATIIFDNRRAAWFAPWRLRTSVRTCCRYTPRVHTQPCVLGANLLRIQVTGLCWRWSDLHRRLGSARPRSAAARSAFTPVVTRPQCVNMLRELLREPLAGGLRASTRCAKHCAKTRRPSLDASLPWGCFANWAS